jgi:5-methylcytosine-specific restriction endonuclease McrA
MGRPRLYSDEERREKRRIKSAKWRAKNVDRAREITRNSMRRAASGERTVVNGGPHGKRIYSEAESLRRYRERTRAWWAKHPERRAPSYREFYLNNKEAVRANDRRRRGRKLGAEGSHTKEDIRHLFLMQKGKCAFCLKPLGKGFHIDHFEPLALGGSNDRSNLRLLHKTCNLSKWAKDPFDHAREHGLLLW